VREYDLIAEWYASERVDETGVPEALALASSLAPDSLVLDIGCGNGIPITRALANAGHRVVGLDSSSEMLTRFQTNFPLFPAVRSVVQSCPFADGLFDGAVAWGVLFHLRQQDQVDAITSVSRVLRPGAPFLFTSGDEDGNREDFTGTMNGIEFHYYSFTIDAYRRILGEHGMTLVDFHTDKGENGYYLARKLA
jgi:cyclopropane fatty-acyl-phospholipid synthase-like methyltransferase